MPARNLILNNFWWKLLSLLLAALTWLTIQTALERDKSLRETPVVGSFSRSFPAVPITILTSSTNTNHYRVEPATALVDISGPAEQLKKLQEHEIHVYIDVSDAGDEKLFRRPVQSLVPHELKVDNLSPTITSVERTTSPK